MSDKSRIEWTEATWNPVTGCTKVSQGCKHCYALRDWRRLSAMPQTVYYGRDFTDVQTHPERLEQPLKWSRPRRIFVNSMSDLFHEAVPDEFIDAVLSVIWRCHIRKAGHVFQVLTKRPERMRDFMRALPSPPPNLWLGVSVEDQKAADERIPLLLDTPAAVRWLSMEPLLGPVRLRKEVSSHEGFNPCGPESWDVHDYLTGWRGRLDHKRCGAGRIGPRIDWVVVGGESGMKARPVHPDWVRSLRAQCEAAGVPFLFKQWGEWAPNCLCDTDRAHNFMPRPQPGKPGVMFRCGKKGAGRQLDGRLHDEYPETVR